MSASRAAPEISRVNIIRTCDTTDAADGNISVGGVDELRWASVPPRKRPGYTYAVQIRGGHN